MESDQAKVSTSELLLEDYLKRLGAVQAHLQSRPTAHLMTPDVLSATTAASGAVLSTVRVLSCAVVLVQLLRGVLSSPLFVFLGDQEGPWEHRKGRKSLHIVELV